VHSIQTSLPSRTSCTSLHSCALNLSQLHDLKVGESRFAGSKYRTSHDTSGSIPEPASIEPNLLHTKVQSGRSRPSGTISNTYLDANPGRDPHYPEKHDSLSLVTHIFICKSPEKLTRHQTWLTPQRHQRAQIAKNVSHSPRVTLSAYPRPLIWRTWTA
jgi:hypothetical protein